MSIPFVIQLAFALTDLWLSIAVQSTLSDSGASVVSLGHLRSRITAVLGQEYRRFMEVFLEEYHHSAYLGRPFRWWVFRRLETFCDGLEDEGHMTLEAFVFLLENFYSGDRIELMRLLHDAVTTVGDYDYETSTVEVIMVAVILANRRHYRNQGRRTINYRAYVPMGQIIRGPWQRIDSAVSTQHEEEAEFQGSDHGEEIVETKTATEVTSEATGLDEQDEHHDDRREGEENVVDVEYIEGERFAWENVPPGEGRALAAQVAEGIDAHIHATDSEKLSGDTHVAGDSPQNNTTQAEVTGGLQHDVPDAPDDNGDNDQADDGPPQHPNISQRPKRTHSTFCVLGDKAVRDLDLFQWQDYEEFVYFLKRFCKGRDYEEAEKEWSDY